MTEPTRNSDLMPEWRSNLPCALAGELVSEAACVTDRMVYQANAPSYHYADDQLARRTLAAAR